MSLKSIVLVVCLILIAAIFCPKLFKQPLSPASASAIAVASGSDSSYSSAIDAASNTEAILVLSMINKACEMYGMDHSLPPANLAALIDAGNIRLSDMNGRCFKQGDYTITKFGDLGNGRTGVLTASVVDSTQKKKYKLTWNPATRRYKMIAQ